MSILKMVVSMLLKKGVMYEGKNVECDFVIPISKEGQKDPDHIRVNFKAEHMTLKMVKDPEIPKSEFEWIKANPAIYSKIEKELLSELFNRKGAYDSWADIPFYDFSSMTDSEIKTEWKKIHDTDYYKTYEKAQRIYELSREITKRGIKLKE